MNRVRRCNRTDAAAAVAAVALLCPSAPPQLEIRWTRGEEVETRGTHAGNATPLQCHPSGIQHRHSPFRVSEYPVLLLSDAHRITLDFRGALRTKGKRDVNEKHCRSLYRSQLNTGGGLKRYRKHAKSPVCSAEVLLQGCRLVNSGGVLQKCTRDVARSPQPCLFPSWLCHKLGRKLSECKAPTSVLAFPSSAAELQPFVTSWTLAWTLGE